MALQKFNEFKRYFHGSMDYLPVGTILAPKHNYEKEWSDTDFYQILETVRSKEFSGMLGHKDGVFMTDNEDDVDNAGGGTEWLFEVLPLGKVEKHDLNWSSEISMHVSDGLTIKDAPVMNAARNYWKGIPHTDENVWEYITPKARILSVEEF